MIDNRLTVPDLKPHKPPYAFSVTIGENCARQMRTFADLADKLKMPVEGPDAPVQR